jgi:hypothetical protein
MPAREYETPPIHSVQETQNSEVREDHESTKWKNARKDAARRFVFFDFRVFAFLL